MQNYMINTDMKKSYKYALRAVGQHWEDVCDTVLGNGSLGRNAACCLDAMVTHNLPAWGYGLRYDHGLPRQVLIGGHQ